MAYQNCLMGASLLTVILLEGLLLLKEASGSRLPMEVLTHRPDHIPLHARAHHYEHRPHKIHSIVDRGPLRVLYQVGRSEADLPECRARAVCNKVDLYDSGAPWVERQCRCVAPDGGEAPCPSTANAEDGHTLVDKTRHYKLCEPIKRLPKCRYFRDTTWTLTTLPEANATEQVVHCHCPRNAVTYLIKRQAYKTANGQTSYQYSFACSPQSRLRCQRKEPCRLFTVRKRQEFLEEVNSSTLCQCPRDHHCPRHHTDPGSISGKSYTEESIRTYSGYCMPS
ncbi:protein giant-lens-like [Ctenocephalides felis]|uniref:protein giant-lens-like n=1 Tax=Ctenocephalides felis TaxID=7515 RepID=UPI000E6E1073|nr:protein giant-lens-like [Ctenocephalides felis]